MSIDIFFYNDCLSLYMVAYSWNRTFRFEYFIKLFILNYNIDLISAC